MESGIEEEFPLRGMRILVVDDEFLIAVLIEETLQDAGAEILSAATLSAALKAANDEPLSAVLLDVRLGNNTTETVADVLAARNIPFFFYSGGALPDSIRAKHPDARILTKPIKAGVLVETLSEIMRNNRH